MSTTTGAESVVSVAAKLIAGEIARSVDGASTFIDVLCSDTVLNVFAGVAQGEFKFRAGALRTQLTVEIRAAGKNPETTKNYVNEALTIVQGRLYMALEDFEKLRSVTVSLSGLASDVRTAMGSGDAARKDAVDVAFLSMYNSLRRSRKNDGLDGDGLLMAVAFLMKHIDDDGNLKPVKVVNM